MCYDVSFTVDLRDITLYFPGGVIFDSEMHIDAAAAVHIMGHSYGYHPILYRHREDGRVHCRLMEWGCIPFYVKEEKSFLRQRASMLNARSERILDDAKSYWFKIRNRRCLVPVSGIYEHRAIRGWKKKVPYYVQLKEQPLFFIPGLYSVVELPDMETGELVKRYTYTLITRNANALMAQIHNDGDNRGRMPLFLPRELSLEWLADELPEERYRAILDYEMPPEAMDYRPVFTIRGTKPRPDGQPRDAYWEWEKLPALGEMDPE